MRFHTSAAPHSALLLNPSQLLRLTCELRLGGLISGFLLQSPRPLGICSRTADGRVQQRAERAKR